MDERACGPAWPDVGDYVEAYEAARARDGRASIDAHGPPGDHPRRPAILCEMIRVELEYRRDGGDPARLEDYRDRFPEVFGDPDLVEALAFEEYRLRLQCGEAPMPSEYRRRFGVEGRDFPPAPLAALAAGDDGASEALRRAAAAYRSHRDQAGDGLAETLAGSGLPGPYADLFGDLHRDDPRSADRLARGIAALPEAGDEVFGFRLEGELGRGAFGRVFLARQAALADRPVALKVAADIAGESRAMAQLQHTNVVPVYSVHRGRGLQAICMPYLGGTTLADVVADLRRHATLPGSGAGLLDSLSRRQNAAGRPDPRSPAERPATERVDPAPGGPTAPAVPPPHVAMPTAQLGRLRGLRYPSAVVWLGSRLADGLAHAHERGILHRDLKPANVLFADDGEPMLLDFNLAADAKVRIHASAALIGGTLPYMAPEQLAAFRDRAPRDDPRSDIYALGLVLFELLTGRPAFEVHRGPVDQVLPRMIADRSGPPPRLRTLNTAVSPAVEAIVRRCLEPDPDRRYAHARQLQEDLQRQLDDLPLKHTPEPSPGERLAKWARRHPRLTSSTTIALASSFLVLALIGLILARHSRLERLEATDSLARLGRDVMQADALLGTRDAPPEQAREGESLCRAVAERYGLLDERRPWTARPLFTRLGADERRRLRDDLGELLFLWARAVGRRAGSTLEPAARGLLGAEALRLNAAAEACFGSGAVPRAVVLQRADLLRRGGRARTAARLEAEAGAIPLRSPRDRLLLVSDRLDRGRFGEALDLFRAAGRGDDGNFALWLLMGNAYAGLDQPDDALGCYSVAIALQPNLRWPRFNRGLLALDQGDYRQAREDFDRVLEIRPGMTEGLINRALARLGLGDARGAVDDVTRALTDPDAPTRALFIRARAYQRQGDLEAARRDQAEGLRRVPRDAMSWLVRGEQRAPADPRGALADFDAALRLNPRLSEALRGRAAVLSERLGRAEEALKSLDAAIELRPASAPLLAGRGVLLARLGRREAAHRDARAALAARHGAEQTYQAACAYALSARQAEADRAEALRLIAEAVRQDPKWFAILPQDRDLDPIRDAPEFRDLVQALGVVCRDSPRPGPEIPPTDQ